ncbi:WD40-repeat-containing domain protein [Chiua virens]|nr:WD40-repeat-containing domain protein [Chiua virens]
MLPLRLRQLLKRRKESNEGSKGKQREETSQDGQKEVIEVVWVTSAYSDRSAMSSKGEEKEVRSTTTETYETKVIKIDSGVNSVVFTTDGKHVLVGGSGGKIRCWRIADVKEVGTPMHARGCVNDIAVSGKWVVSGADRGHVKVFDVESREIVRELKGHTDDVYAVDVSPDGTTIVSGSYDETARIWSLSTGKELKILKYDYEVAAVKFSPDGLFIATATWTYESVRIYKTENGQLLAKFKINIGSWSNQSIAWPHDSKYLFVAGSDGYIHHLDVPGKTFSKWRIHSNNSPSCIALSSDNSFIAASRGQFVSFWDIATHEQIGSPVKYATDVFSVAISPNDDMVTRTYSIVMLQDLYDILPLHYCSNARKFHNKLTDLRSRYEAQSRKLRIAVLTAELEALKRSVATKTSELVAVREELDKFPDVSHELLAARNDLRTYEAGFHRLHQQHNVQLRNITSVVAKDQPESPDIRHGVDDSDVYAEKAIVRTLESLNKVIQRTSMSISTYFIHHIQSSNTEEHLSAARHASESIPPALVDRLRTVLHHDLSSYLSIAFQAYLTSHARSIVSSWTMDKRTDELLSKAYEQLRKSETQTFAAGWRSLIHANIPACTSTSKNLVSHAIQGLSDIVVAAGCAASTSDTASKMSPKFWHNISSIISTAENLRELIGNALAADFKVVVARPAQMFDEASMVQDSERGRGVPAGQARGKRVLCTTCLGLIKEVVQESPISWQRNTLSASVVVKPGVVLRDSR